MQALYLEFNSNFKETISLADIKTGNKKINSNVSFQKQCPALTVYTSHTSLLTVIIKTIDSGVCKLSKRTRILFLKRDVAAV